MKFLTFLNSGCIEICKNMLVSAEKAGINMDDFYIACLDSNSYESLKDYKNSFLYIDQPIVEYQNWTFDENSGFRNIVKNKWSIIKKIYQENKNLCWVDTDIVFVKNPINLLEGNEEVLFQSDSPGSTLCSGFMVFNDTKECESLVNECGFNETEDDQLIVNEIALKKYRDNIALLSPDLFPNGHVYYNEGKKENAYIVHNNWMVGVNTKIAKFKEEGLWFI
jgi:hypothetical protein